MPKKRRKKTKKENQLSYWESYQERKALLIRAIKNDIVPDQAIELLLADLKRMGN